MTHIKIDVFPEFEDDRHIVVNDNNGKWFVIILNTRHHREERIILEKPEMEALIKAVRMTDVKLVRDILFDV